MGADQREGRGTTYVPPGLIGEEEFHSEITTVYANVDQRCLVTCVSPRLPGLGSPIDPHSASSCN